MMAPNGVHQSEQEIMEYNGAGWRLETAAAAAIMYTCRPVIQLHPGGAQFATSRPR